MSKRKNTRPYLLTAMWERHPQFDQDRLTALIELDGTKITHHIVFGQEVRVHDLGEIEAWVTEQGCKRTFHQELPAHVASQSSINIRNRDMALAFRMRFS